MHELDLPNFLTLKAVKLVDGKLVAIPKEEMWAEWWKDAENRQKTLALPGFDAVELEKITGIKI